MRSKFKVSPPTLLFFAVISITVTINFTPTLIQCSESEMAACSFFLANSLLKTSNTTMKLRGINAEDPSNSSHHGTHVKPAEIQVNTTVHRSMFRKDFIWGTATAAYQANSFILIVSFS